MRNGNHKGSNLSKMALVTIFGIKELKLDHVAIVAGRCKMERGDVRGFGREERTGLGFDFLETKGTDKE
jgi:hypothetical protein